MSIFNFNLPEIFTFFCVLVRLSVLFTVLPFIGDRAVPSQVKILISFITSVISFPILIAKGEVNPNDSLSWSVSSMGIFQTIATEVIFALAVGFAAKLVFEGISLGGNLVGIFVGFATASSYDPHQESQSQVAAQLQTSLAMLVFLAINGHHLMLKAVLQSFHYVGINKANFSGALSDFFIHLTGEVFKLGLQLSAPVAVSIFAINIALAIISKALPQLNILSISLSMTVWVGLIVMWLSLDDFQGMLSQIFEKIGEWMQLMMIAVGHS